MIVNASEEPSSRRSLPQTWVEIVTVFSARLYGSRSHKDKAVMETLATAAKEVSP